MADTPGAPPEARMFELTFDAIVGARCCYVLAKLRLADRLADGPHSSDDLARSAGVDPSALYRLLRAAGGLGLVTESPDRMFALTELGATLRSDVPGSMRAWAEFSGEPYYLSAWVDILHAIETGRPSFDHVHGRSFFDYLAAHRDQSQVFDEAMTSLTSTDAPALAAAYDFSSCRRIVDLGGGQGSLLFEVLRRHDEPTGVIFDLPHVAEGVRARVAELDLAGRCEVVAGDFFVEVPPADAYLLKFILHDWDDEACARILASCRRAIASNGRLVVVETLIPPLGSSGHARLDDVEMMLLLGSQERTETEYAALFASAGFRLSRVVPATDWLNVIEAEPV